MSDHIRFALRQMRKNPGFAVLAVVTLALGIGANTAMFTVIDSVMLRPLAYRDGDRIMAITTGAAEHGNVVETTSWLNYVDLRDQSRQFRSIAAYAIDFPVVRTTQESRATPAVKATAPLFDVLGVQPALGRPFLDSDNQPGAGNVVILSSGFWRERFGSDPRAIGQQVRVGDDPYTVVGVMPDNFRFQGNDVSSGIWLPFQPDSDLLKNRNANFLYLLGTLRPGVSQQAAQAEIISITRGITQKDPVNAKDLAFRLIPFRDVVTAQVRPVFLALTGALVLVLLIACANVANLQLARCLARGQEFAVRRALGASRRTLLTQMLVEGGVLCFLGAVAGIGLAQLMLAGIHRLPLDLIPRAEEIHLRLSVFLILLLATTVVTLLSSIAPALVAMLSDPQSVLQEGTRGSSTGRGRALLSGLMVAVEVALSVILLVSGGLMFRTLYNLQHIHLGFQEENVTSFIALPGSAAGFFAQKKPEDIRQEDSIALRLYAPMQEKLRHLPGVADAAFASVIPFERIVVNSTFDIVGRPRIQEEAKKDHALVRIVSDSYERVMGAPILRGRAITDQDTTGSQYVVVINETLAKQYFSGENPLGQQIDFGGDSEKDRLLSGMVQPYTIVGVVGDSMQHDIVQPIAPEVDLPYSQIPVKSFMYPSLVMPITTFVVRTHGRVELAPTVRNVFHESAPDFAVDNVQTMQAAHDDADSNQRIGLYLVMSFAGIAMVMVLAGLYGVLSQLVGQRRREIGIRMAVGADRKAIIGLILRRGLFLIAIGVVAGLAAAVGVQQWVKSFLYGVSPVDAMTYAVVVVVLAVVGVVAGLVPARRAASIEPTQALRTE
ncbi:MAG TPA: ABC transporter permease [Candidatus Angelobacter sp.]